MQWWLIRRQGLLHIFELKSIKQELFYELTEPSEEYLDQVHVYMYMTSIPRAIVFYENKNNQEIKEFAIELDQKRLDEVLTKIITIQAFVTEYDKSGLLPPKCKQKWCVGCNS